MRLEAGADQDEAVRLEQVAEVDVGKGPRVRRVTRLLEAVEVERGEWIDRRNLIVDEHMTPRHGDPHELGDRRLRMGNVMQHAPCAGEIERAGLERKVRRIALDEGDVLRRSLACPLQ